MNLLRVIIVVALLGFGLSCSKNAQQKTDSEASNLKMDSTSSGLSKNVGVGIPVGYCRVVAEVVSIDEVLDTDNPDEPCGKAPCNAKIRIVRVVGTGMSFSPPVMVDNTYDARFAYTTGPTTELFPDMAEQYPGVKVGDQIQVDLAGVKPSMGSQEKSGAYTIHGYAVQ